MTSLNDTNSTEHHIHHDQEMQDDIGNNNEKMLYKFVHTFGYHRKPKPVAIPKMMKISSQKRFHECAEQLEFNHTIYFMKDSEELWIDHSVDDYKMLTEKITNETDNKIKVLKNEIATTNNPSESTKNNDAQQKEQLSFNDDIIKISPKCLPVIDVKRDLQQITSIDYINNNNDENSSSYLKDIFVEMIDKEFSTNISDMTNPISNSTNFLTDNKYNKILYEMLPWENEIIPFNKNISRNMMDTLKAGWIPSTDIRTWKDFITKEFQKNSLEHETLLLLLNVLASLKMVSDHPDGSYNVKDWYNLLITSISKNYETDIYSLQTYITRHLMSTQTANYSRHLSMISSIRDFMNVSNDKYYADGKKTHNEDIFDDSPLNIKHAYPAEIMHRTLMPIYLDCIAARQFHRPILTPLAYGPLSKPGYRLVRNLQSHIKKKSKEIIKKRKLYGYSDISFMQTLDDITSTDGHIILVEYSEEFPPFLCQNGMNSMLVQYCKLVSDEKKFNQASSTTMNLDQSSGSIPRSNNQNNHQYGSTNFRNHSNSTLTSNNNKINVNMKHSNSQQHNTTTSIIPKTNVAISEIGTETVINNLNDNSRPKFSEYGKPMFVDKISPFLGTLSPNQIILAIENNLYRAPLFRHDIIPTDFLVIRNSGGYFIREFQSVFVAGQQIPKKAIPTPGSKASTKYNRDLLQVYIYRQFHRSKDIPPRLKTDEIRRLFKHNSENAIRKRLKYCSDYNRNSSVPGEVGSWHLRDNFSLPSFDEMTKLCRPEDACVYFGMITAERRLKDLGYDKKIYSVSENGDDDALDTLRGEDEILCAPWNTTRAYLDAIRGKCVLSIQDGPADPTGKSLAFSYTKIDSRCYTMPTSSELVPNQVVEGTKNNSSKSSSIHQTDLRKINMKVAKKYLISFGMNSKKVDEMTRWEVVDAIKKYVQDEKSLPAMFQKYTRTTKILTPQAIQHFKKACQQQFEIQNRSLSSTEVPQFNETLNRVVEESDRDIIDNEQLGKDLEGFLNDIQIYDSSEASNVGDDDDDMNSTSETASVASVKVSKHKNVSRLSKNIPSKLVIKRVFNDNGKTYERTEILTNPRIINAYLKTIQKNKILKEKIQVLSKPRHKNTKLSMHNLSRSLSFIDTSQKSKLPSITNVNVNNKEIIDSTISGSLNEISKNDSSEVKFVAPIKMEQNRSINSPVGSATIPVKLKFNFDEPQKTNNVKIEGTKLYIDKSLLESSKDKKKTSQLSKQSKEDVTHNNRKRKLSDSYDYYFYKPFKSHGRRRTNPQVSLNVIFESIVGELKKINNSWPFHQPVSSKLVADYYNIVKEPMDLQTLKDLTIKHTFNSRKEFLEKVKLIETNCILYNGINSPLTVTAKKIVETCQSIINEKDEEIFAIEKDINPMLDEDAQIPLSWIFENIVSKVKAMNEAYPFLQPVNLKIFPNYLDYVSSPIDLSQIKVNCHKHKYSDVDSFMYDIRLLYENSVKFNGEEHNVTKFANKVIQTVEEELLKMNEHIRALQDEIASQPSHLKKFYEETRRNDRSLNKKSKKNLTHSFKDKVITDTDKFDVLKDLEMSDDDDDND